MARFRDAVTWIPPLLNAKGELLYDWDLAQQEFKVLAQTDDDGNEGFNVLIQFPDKGVYYAMGIDIE